MKELRQRRKRKKKMGVLKRRAVKASASEKAVMAAKIRRMTPGCEIIIAALGLEEKR
jgi:hypothetical protein